jgi:hypothetical protein
MVSWFVKEALDKSAKADGERFFGQVEVRNVQLYFVYPQGACRIRKAAKPPTAAQYRKLSEPMD